MTLFNSSFKSLKGVSGVYCIKNTSNNKKYIGLATNLYDRLMNHISALRSNRHSILELQNDFLLYGENQFQIEILYSGLSNPKRSRLMIIESRLIKKLKPEYNTRVNTNGISIYG